MRLELVTAPAAEPILLADAKAHLRATASDEDALITRLIGAARRQVEAITRRKLITQTWKVYYDFFPWAGTFYGRLAWDFRYFKGADIILPDLAPASSIVALQYIDTDGNTQTLDPSVYKLVKEAPPRVALAYNQSWPSIRGDRESVIVQVTSGYGTAGSNVPEDILAAMLLIIGHLYENREMVIVDARVAAESIPFAAEALLSPYVVPSF